MQILETLASILPLLELSETEVRVYSALIELGRGDASRIAKRAGLPRTSTYSVLERLKERGLVSQEKKAHGTNFVPSSPSALVEIAEDQFRRSKRAVDAARELSKQLESTMGRDSLTLPKVRIFEGRPAIKQMLYSQQDAWRSSIIAYKTAWLGFQDDSFLLHYGHWVRDYWHKYKDAPDKDLDVVKIFSNATSFEEKFKREVEPVAGKRRQLRPLPSKFRFSGTVWVNGEYLIALKTRSDPHYGIQIRDRVLAENVGGIFEFVWEVTG